MFASNIIGAISVAIQVLPKFITSKPLKDWHGQGLYIFWFAVLVGGKLQDLFLRPLKVYMRNYPEVPRNSGAINTIVFSRIYHSSFLKYTCEYKSISDTKICIQVVPEKMSR